MGLPHPPQGCSHSCPHRYPARGKKTRKAQSGAGEAGPSSELCPTGPQPAERPHFLPHITSCGPTPHPAGSDSTLWLRALPGALHFAHFFSRDYSHPHRRQAQSSPATSRAQAPELPQPRSLVHSRNAPVGPFPPASASAPCLPSAPHPAGFQEGKQKRSEPERGRGRHVSRQESRQPAKPCQMHFLSARDLPALLATPSQRPASSQLAVQPVPEPVLGGRGPLPPPSRCQG